MNTVEKTVQSNDFCVICWNDFNCSKHSKKKITITSFDFRTGEYTTHTETVELN